MSLKDDFNNFMKTNRGSDDVTKDVPETWRPRSEIGTEGGFLITTPRATGNLPDHREAMVEAGLNPDEWEVISVRRGRWQKFDGEWLESLRVNVQPIVSAVIPDYDLEELKKSMAKWKPGKVKETAGNLTAVYSVGDTQYGKDDTPAIVDRMHRALEEVIAHYEYVSKRYDIAQIAIPQLGDCIEGMTSQKGKVMGRHDIGVAEQVAVGRRMLLTWIQALAPLTSKLIVPVVPGNHDEVQRFLVGRAEDSWQIDIVRGAEDACMLNDFLKDRVEFRYPALDDSTLAVNLSGVLYGMAHGHQNANMVKWWSGQVMGRCSVANADILNVGHLHHYDVQSIGRRLFIQNPAMDNGSAWWRDKSGLEGDPGIVAMLVGEGFDTRRELVVLGGKR
jgi:hypothetical protein